ncbi:exo-alpha-sialidase [Ravibacter arvi]
MRSKFLGVLIGCLCLLHAASGQKSSAGEMVLHLTTDANNPRNSEGSFVRLKDGRILYVYSRFEGSSSDHAPARLMGRISGDNGRTWTQTDKLIIDREGDMNVMSVSLLRLRNGRIALIYARKNSLDDCIPQIRFSDDEASTWSAPKPVITDKTGYFVVNNDRVIQLRSGRILVPVSLHKTKATEWSNKGQLRCYYSDDDGLSWKTGNALPAPDSVITQEPGVVELADGRVMMIIRASGGRQFQAYSADGGITWAPATQSGLRSPLSPASVKRIPGSNDLLAVANNNGASGPGYFKSKRTPLTVSISPDNGLTWQAVADLENNPDETYAYTAIHFQEGHALFAYYVKPDNDPGFSIKIRRYALRELYRLKKELPLLLAANKHSNTLSFVDPIGRDVLQTISTGPNPHEIIVTPDQRFAYLSNYAPPGNTISVIDLKNRKHISQISTGEIGRIHGTAMAPDGKRAYFTAGQTGFVVEVDTKTNKVVRNIPTHGKISHMVYISPDGKYLLTANIVSENISVIDRKTGGLLRQIPAGAGVEGMAFTPDHKKLWALNQTAGSITVIDVATWQPEETFPCEGMPVRIRFTKDGSQALVANWVKDGKLTIIDTRTKKEIKRIPVGDFAIGVELSSEGRYVFVGCEDSRKAEVFKDGSEKSEAHKTVSDGIHVIDLQKMEVIDIIKTGLGPDPMVMWFPARGKSVIGSR